MRQHPILKLPFGIFDADHFDTALAKDLHVGLFEHVMSTEEVHALQSLREMGNHVSKCAGARHQASRAQQDSKILGEGRALQHDLNSPFAECGLDGINARIAAVFEYKPHARRLFPLHYRKIERSRRLTISRMEFRTGENITGAKMQHEVFFAQARIGYADVPGQQRADIVGE